MGRDIRVESKHFVYRGSKSSDLLIAFDHFFSYFPRYDVGDGMFFAVNLSKKDMKQVLDFVEKGNVSNGRVYRNADELIEQLNSIYICMTPNDIVEVEMW